VSIELCHLFVGNFGFDFGRYAGYKRPVWDFHLIGNHAAGGNDTVIANLGLIQYGGIIAD
jgi:hypothetical protein